MIWFGPSGIGAIYTRERYQRQHRRPLVDNFNFDVPIYEGGIGHICRNFMKIQRGDVLTNMRKRLSIPPDSE